MANEINALPEEHQERICEISSALALTEDSELIADFLYSILTPTEAQNIATRWELVKLMDRGVSQRKISERLGLSLCKITRGSKELKKEDSAFGKMIHIYDTRIAPEES
jgi:TrpR family transcriptional regulator, trp operon repressor